MILMMLFDAGWDKKKKGAGNELWKKSTGDLYGKEKNKIMFKKEEEERRIF